MKKLYLFAALATMLAACSENDLTAEKQSPQAQQNGEQAVVFDAYTSRSTTRAGYQGTLFQTQLEKSEADKGGFGVFAYYTNNEGYSELAKPDFMYNQGVFKSGDNWIYSPIKYWPNEFGGEAQSERIDYLTFFAYAPYVKADPKTGKVDNIKSDETGIIGFTRNTAIGDPLVKYVADFTPAKGVDLCWGVANANFVDEVPTTAPENNIDKDKPYIDVIKPQINTKIHFNFKHALAQLNVQIDADIDAESHSGGELNNQTRIYVRSVSFEGFTDRGTLNLNSNFVDGERPIWYNIAGNGNLSTTPITIYDGRYDGREGVTSVAAPAESPKGLNPKIIQEKPYTIDPFASDTDDPGVTHTPQNLFNGGELTTPILVIPNGQAMKVKIVYDVETYDPSLATFLSDGKTHGSTIENAITKEITIGTSTPMELASGKKYTVKLHLGLTSVKFDATVSGWEDSTGGDGEADLPINLLSASNGSTLNTTIGAAGGDFTFTFSGAVGTCTESNTPTDADVTKKSQSGESITLTVVANPSTSKRTHVVKVSDATDPTPQEVIVNITQDPASLDFTAATYDGSAHTVTCTISNSDVTALNASGIEVTMTKDGSPFTDFTKAASKILTMTSYAAGAYTVTIKANDADPVTQNFTID